MGNRRDRNTTSGGGGGGTNAGGSNRRSARRTDSPSSVRSVRNSSALRGGRGGRGGTKKQSGNKSGAGIWGTASSSVAYHINSQVKNPQLYALGQNIDSMSAG